MHHEAMHRNHCCTSSRTDCRFLSSSRSGRIACCSLKPPHVTCNKPCRIDEWPQLRPFFFEVIIGPSCKKQDTGLEARKPQAQPPRLS